MEKTPKPPLEELVADIAVGLAETRRNLEGTRRLLEENARADKKHAAEAAAGLAAVHKALEDSGKQIKETNQNIGGLGNAEGEELENDVADALEAAGEIGGIRIDCINLNMRSKTFGCQFDIVAINGKYVVVVEAKRQLTMEDVRRFADRNFPLFARAFPDEARGRKLRGAMVYRRTHPGGSAVDAALKEGFLVLGVNNNNTLYQVKSAKDIINQAKTRAVKK